MAATILMALLLAAGIEVTIQQKCHMNDLQTCILKLREFADNNPLPLPRNREEFDEQCRILKEVRECAYNYSQNCVSELGRTIGDLLVLPTGEKMRNFCSPEHELHINYLKNAQCIADNYGAVTPCVKTALAGLETLPKRDRNERLPAFCCAIGQFRSCLNDHYLKACNQDVVDLIKIIIEFGMSDIASDACIAIENAITCPELPPPGTPLDGSYNKNILGMVVGSFMRE